MTIDASSLKLILSRLRTPDRLDNHPWTRSLIVQDAVRGDPALAQKSPGLQLVRALANLFRETMPPTPPHDGKRVDTRWGRFGILASNYFAPLVFGRLYPRSLLEAWRRIDASILLFVYGKTSKDLAPEQVNAYQLVGDELAFPASSTISDWHRQGIDELASLFAARERALSESLRKPSPVLNLPPEQATRGARHRVLRVVGLIVLAAVLAGGALFADKANRVYRRTQAVRSDVAELQGLSLQPETLDRAGPLLDRTSEDLRALRVEVAPWLPVARRLGWIPTYGGDLAQAGDLLELAADSIQAAQQTVHTASPIYTAVHTDSNLKAADLTKMLLDAQPRLTEAQATLGQAFAVRKRIETRGLSPEVCLVVQRLDLYLSRLDESLTLAQAVPGLLGGSPTGPKTYLILVENEDELRPTGGLISAVGKAVVWNGQLLDLKIEDSYTVDDPEKAYPAAPWQMQQFMNIPIMVFRDTSWFTDYPTAVRWAEYLYAYANSYSVDGVIAIDQNFMATLLSVTGPVYVPEIQETVNADNLRAVMREQKVPPPEFLNDPSWNRKHFLNPISTAILQRLMGGKGISWEALARALVAQLDQHHVLVRLDDPVLTQLLAQRGWDGAVRNNVGDLLMVVDTNVGYNKTNAVVSPSISYDVNLTTLTDPTSSLLVSYTNNAKETGEKCQELPVDLSKALLESWYIIDRCYYDYLRVYLPAGTEYLSGTPQAISRDEMEFLEADVPARVDTLDEELPGIQAFGTLLVAPIGKTTQIGFDFRLPPAVVQVGTAANARLYHLKIEKQAGQQPIPVTLRVHLPPGSLVRSANQQYMQSGADMLFNLSLATDIDVQIEFQP